MMISAELASFLVENCPDALSHHGPDGAFLYASPGCRAVFGQAPEALLGRLLSDLLAGADVGPFQARWAAALKAGGQSSLRYSISGENGRCTWIETRLRVVPAAAPGRAGSPNAADQVVCSSTEVTAEVEAERALAARLERATLAERHRDFLVDMTPGMVWVAPVGADGKRPHATYMSPYLFDVTGFSAEEWLSTPNMLWRIMHPDDVERTRKAVDEAVAAGIPVPPYRILGKNGRTLWIQSFTRTERDAGGTPVRMYGLTLDVTVFKEAEVARAEALERMRVLKQRLDTLVSTLPGIVWETWEPAHRDAVHSDFCSDYVEDLTGFSPAEWSSGADAWLRLVPDDDREAVRQAISGLTGDRRASLQHRLQAKNGCELWLENHMVVVRDAAGAAICTRGIALDITQRERLRQENARQAERLLELSAPILPVTDDVVILPLVGTVDATRARHVLSSLLHGVVSARARIAIIDLTGVGALDAESASTLVQATATARLLGARVVLTGLRPETVQTLLQLDLDLGAITTRSTLRSAIRELVAPSPRR